MKFNKSKKFFAGLMASLFVSGIGFNAKAIRTLEEVYELTAKTINGTRTATTNTGGGDSFGLFLDGKVSATNINGTGVMGIYLPSTVDLGTTTNSIIGTGTQSYGIYADGTQMTVSTLIRGNTSGNLGLYFKNCTINIKNGSIIGRLYTSGSTIKTRNIYTCGITNIEWGEITIEGGEMNNTCPS